MSFDQLMDHAHEIEKSAIETEYQQQMRIASSGGAHGGAGVMVDRDQIEKKYQGTLDKLFEPFTHIPNPKSYDAAMEYISDAMKDLSDGKMNDPINDRIFPSNQKFSHIKSASDKIEDWTGEAADKFKTKFIDPFDSVSTNHFLALAVMKGALEAHRKMCDKARDDIDDIAHKTIDGLDNVGSCSQSDVNFAFAIVTAVAAVGAIPFTGGASAGIAVVGAAGAAGSAGVAGKEAFKASGGSAEQVVKSMKQAIDKLTNKIRDNENKISKALSDIDEEIKNNKQGFVSARPKLAGMEGDELTSDNGLGRAE